MTQSRRIISGTEMMMMMMISTTLANTPKQ
jgi:hypothetical protein